MNGMMTLFGEATRYMKKTSDSGNTNSMFGYVFLLKTGSGVLTNKKEAAKLFIKVSDAGCFDGYKEYDELFDGFVL